MLSYGQAAAYQDRAKKLYCMESDLGLVRTKNDDDAISGEQCNAKVQAERWNL